MSGWGLVLFVLICCMTGVSLALSTWSRRMPDRDRAMEYTAIAVWISVAAVVIALADVALTFTA